MLIGFAGKAAAGKTTAARHLAGLFERETLIAPMAMVLREEVAAFLTACGPEEHLPLVHGSQEDKLKIFYLDRQKAMAACPRWADFLAAHADLQDRPGVSAVSVRRLLQWWGTEYRRAEDADYWTKAWQRKVAGYDLGQVHVLVDDVRFMNEVEVIRELGGRFVKIVRPGTAAGGNHASETSLDSFEGWDAIIVNDGTLTEFKARVAELSDAFGPG